MEIRLERMCVEQKYFIIKIYFIMEGERICAQR